MKMYTLTEIAAVARISPKTLWRRMREGDAPHTVRVGKQRLCSQADLDLWLRR